MLIVSVVSWIQVNMSVLLKPRLGTVQGWLRLFEPVSIMAWFNL